jgi:hypothetical protein
MAIGIGRRQFISALGGAAAAWPLTARAQQSPKKVPVVGVLWHAGSAEEEDVYLSVLRKAFSDLGYIEDKNIQLEHRFPAEQPDRFRSRMRPVQRKRPRRRRLRRLSSDLLTYPISTTEITSLLAARGADRYMSGFSGLQDAAS